MPRRVMLPRRAALLGLWSTLCLLLGCRSRSRPVATSTQAEELLRELGRSGARAYSEEGIPMFLVGENLAADAVPTPPAGLNLQLAADFRAHAGLLAQVRPNAVPGDVAKLVEWLAERDFGTTSSRFRS